MHIDTTQPTYAALCTTFQWTIPSRFNIGVACSDSIAAAKPNAPAIIDIEANTARQCSFAQLARLSNQFANVLTAHGIGPGDRVAIMAPQSIETAVAHLATYKAGGVAVPMAVQFGSDAISYRLRRSGATVMVCEAKVLQRLAAIDLQQTALKTVIVTDADGETNAIAAHSFSAMIAKASATFQPVDTSKDDPAMMLFTSGTTGSPKPALHAHRVLAGHLPGIQISQAMMPQNGDRLWTPSDWAWAGGLLNALLPALYLGVTVVAARTPKFEADWAFNLIDANNIANIFMPATALRLMLNARQTMPAHVRSIGSAGEALGARTLMQAKNDWQLDIDEFYGQTECNTVLGSSARLGSSRPGSMGKPTPGHTVAVLDDEGLPLAVGETGQIAIARPDPVMFLGYDNEPETTAEKFNGDWLLTGDQAYVDADGFFHFVGRNDDIITSSGYRIGPTEIEDALTAHHAVKLAAVVGHDDEVRTQRIVAYVVLNQGFSPAPELVDALRQHVRNKLSAHQYPRDIEFVDTIPTTESGKIIRRQFRPQR